MPFVDIAGGVDAAINNGIKIFYRTYGRGPVKVLMIIGLAGTHESWGPQIKGIAGTATPNDEQWSADDRRLPEEGDGRYSGGNGVEVCVFDNRGMGRSSIPTKNSEYTTRIMAKDAIAVMDHLGWKRAHVFGHSMGGMIACKLAATVPDRIISLALLNVTGGGYECLPKFDRQTLSIAIRFLKAKTPEQRAAVDLDTHYTKEYLEECVGLKTRRAILYQEYVKGISASGMQSNCGFDGQINACWTHNISRTELEFIRSTGFLISVIHGRHDIIAQIGHAKRLAEKLHPYARMVDLHGGHLVSHERTQEVNDALLELIKAAENKISPHEWTNLPTKSSSKHHKVKPSRVSSINDLQTSEIGGWLVTWASSNRKNPDRGSNYSLMFGIAEKMSLIVLYIFGLFVLAFEFLQRAVKHLNKASKSWSCTHVSLTFPSPFRLQVYASSFT